MVQEDRLHKLYISILDRAADNTGFKYWQDVNNKQNLEAHKLASFFLQNKESKSNFDLINKIQVAQESIKNYYKDNPQKLANLPLDQSVKSLFLDVNSDDAPVIKFAEQVFKNTTSRNINSAEFLKLKGIVRSVLQDEKFDGGKIKNFDQIYETLAKLTSKISDDFDSNYLKNSVKISKTIVEKLDQVGYQTPSQVNDQGYYDPARALKDVLREVSQRDFGQVDDKVKKQLNEYDKAREFFKGGFSVLPVVDEDAPPPPPDALEVEQEVKVKKWITINSNDYKDDPLTLDKVSSESPVSIKFGEGYNEVKADAKAVEEVDFEDGENKSLTLVAKDGFAEDVIIKQKGKGTIAFSGKPQADKDTTLKIQRDIFDEDNNEIKVDLNDAVYDASQLAAGKKFKLDIKASEKALNETFTINLGKKVGADDARAAVNVELTPSSVAGDNDTVDISTFTGAGQLTVQDLEDKDKGGSHFVIKNFGVGDQIKLPSSVGVLNIVQREASDNVYTIPPRNENDQWFLLTQKNNSSAYIVKITGTGEAGDPKKGDKSAVLNDSDGVIKLENVQAEVLNKWLSTDATDKAITTTGGVLQGADNYTFATATGKYEVAKDVELKTTLKEQKVILAHEDVNTTMKEPPDGGTVPDDQNPKYVLEMVDNANKVKISEKLIDKVVFGSASAAGAASSGGGGGGSGGSSGGSGSGSGSSGGTATTATEKVLSFEAEPGDDGSIGNFEAAQSLTVSGVGKVDIVGKATAANTVININTDGSKDTSKLTVGVGSATLSAESYMSNTPSSFNLNINGSSTKNTETFKFDFGGSVSADSVRPSIKVNLSPLSVDGDTDSVDVSNVNLGSLSFVGLDKMDKAGKLFTIANFGEGDKIILDSGDSPADVTLNIRKIKSGEILDTKNLPTRISSKDGYYLMFKEGTQDLYLVKIAKGGKDATPTKDSPDTVLGASDSVIRLENVDPEIFKALNAKKHGDAIKAEGGAFTGSETLVADDSNKIPLKPQSNQLQEKKVYDLFIKNDDYKKNVLTVDKVEDRPADAKPDDVYLVKFVNPAKIASVNKPLVKGVDFENTATATNDFKTLVIDATNSADSVFKNGDEFTIKGNGKVVLKGPSAVGSNKIVLRNDVKLVEKADKSGSDPDTTSVVIGIKDMQVDFEKYKDTTKGTHQDVTIEVQASSSVKANETFQFDLGNFVGADRINPKFSIVLSPDDSADTVDLSNLSLGNFNINIENASLSSTPPDYLEIRNFGVGDTIKLGEDVDTLKTSSFASDKKFFEDDENPVPARDDTATKWHFLYKEGGNDAYIIRLAKKDINDKAEFQSNDLIIKLVGIDSGVMAKLTEGDISLSGGDLTGELKE